MGRKTRRQYTADFKAEAVRMVVEDDRKIKDVAARLGITTGMLNRWCQEQERRERAGEGARADEAEVRRLRRRVRQLEQEREILKKAAAFFARESD
jgi:transposase